MAEGVVLLLIVAGVAAAEVIVRVIDASPFAQQRVDNLVFLAVRGEDQGGDVVREPGTQNSLLKICDGITKGQQSFPITRSFKSV